MLEGGCLALMLVVVEVVEKNYILNAVEVAGPAAVLRMAEE
jgi:hypothetical protein